MHTQQIDEKKHILLRLGFGNSGFGKRKKKSSKEIMWVYKNIAGRGHFLPKADLGLFVAIALATLRESLCDSVVL